MTSAKKWRKTTEWEKLEISSGNQSWIFTGRTDAEAETPILWPSGMKNWFTGKDPDARKDWRQEEKGTTEDEMVGWHHRLNGLEFEQTLGVGDGQGSLACCSPWGSKESDTTEWLNWTVWTEEEKRGISLLLARQTGKNVCGEKTVYSTSGTEQTEQPHAQEWKWTPILYCTKQLNQNGLNMWM